MRTSIALIIMLLYGCSPQKRLNRLIDKHPELVQKDTIKLSDTIITKEVVKDTMFSINFDTITLSKDKLRVQVIRKRDSIYLRGECKADTIYRDIEIPVDKVVYKKQTIVKDIIDNMFIILFLIICFLLILKWRTKN